METNFIIDIMTILEKEEVMVEEETITLMTTRTLIFKDPFIKETRIKIKRILERTLILIIIKKDSEDTTKIRAPMTTI